MSKHIFAALVTVVCTATVAAQQFQSRAPEFDFKHMKLNVQITGALIQRNALRGEVMVKPRRGWV